MRRIVPLAAALALSGIIAHAPSAWACSCATTTTQKYFATADAVFVGTVTAISTPAPTVVRADMTVTGVYKGTVPGSTGVHTPRDSASCGIGFVPGTRYAVFASFQNGLYRADLCHGTTRDVGLLARAGFHPGSPSTPVAAPADPAASSDSRTGAVIGSALIIVLVGAGILVLRRRRAGAGG